MQSEVNVNAAQVGMVIKTRTGAAEIVQIDEYTDARGIRLESGAYYLVSRTDHPLTRLA